MPPKRISLACMERNWERRHILSWRTGGLELVKDINVQTSGDNTKMENAVLKIMQQEREIDDEIDRLVDLKAEIRKVIAGVQVIEYRLLLELRYLCFQSWEEIAVRMGYSIDYVFKIHRKALEMVEVP